MSWQGDISIPLLKNGLCFVCIPGLRPGWLYIYIRRCLQAAVVTLFLELCRALLALALRWEGICCGGTIRDSVSDRAVNA